MNGLEHAVGGIASYCMAKGYGLIHTARHERKVRFGVDIDDLPLLRDYAVFPGHTVGSGVRYPIALPFTWPTTCYGYGLCMWIDAGGWTTMGNEISLELGSTITINNRGCKLWITRNAGTGQLSYRITTSRIADGADSDETFVSDTVVPGLICTNAESISLLVILQGHRLYFSPDGGSAATGVSELYNVIFDGYVPRTGGRWKPVIRCAAGTVASGVMKIGLAVDGEPQAMSGNPYPTVMTMPQLIDFEFSSPTIPREIWGGSGPHPSALATALIVQPVVDACDFSAV